MQNESEEILKKKIKKNIYGKLQTVKAIFPPGFGATALDEIQSILGNLWFAKNAESECSLSKNDIRINKIHMMAAIELLMRSQCLSDIRLVVFKGKSIGKTAFEKQCRNIDWNFYINKTMSLKVKVNSIASRAFHETGLKEILTHILREYTDEIVSGENTTETTCIYADLYKDKLNISISLAGNPLYKRGYRGALSASAPLREDAAACCIQKALTFAKKLNDHFSPNTVIIPFSGTGTFAFEYLQYYSCFSPVLCEREYALKEMPLFRQESFNYLLKKAKEHCLFLEPQDEKTALNVCCIDNSDNANTALLQNMENFKQLFIKNNCNLSSHVFFQNNSNDFLKTDIHTILGNTFMLLNPPYGVRFGCYSDTVSLYKNIAHKINEISKKTKKEQKNLLGFILCPSEETWSSFYRNLKYLEIETYHFTQGGMDVRVCQFFV